MRYFLMGVILVLVAATPVRGATELTDGVNARWFPRSPSTTLHAIAVERVLEISRCGQCMTHTLQRRNTAEVLGYNAGYTDPIRQVIRAWAQSAIHNAILSGRDLHRIGCAHRVVSGRHYFACVLR
jgi:hypothetical protein